MWKATVESVPSDLCSKAKGDPALLARALQSSITADAQNGSVAQTRRFLLSLCSRVLTGDLRADSVSKALAAFGATKGASCGEGEWPSMLADALWLSGCSVQFSASVVSKKTVPKDKQPYQTSDEWARLTKLVQLLLKAKVLERRMVKGRLPLKLLSDSGCIKFPLYRKYLVKANTKAKFTQDKYNLLREESEGYAKLITVLSQECNQTAAAASAPLATTAR